MELNRHLPDFGRKRTDHPKTTAAFPVLRTDIEHVCDLLPSMHAHDAVGGADDFHQRANVRVLQEVLNTFAPVHAERLAVLLDDDVVYGLNHSSLSISRGVHSIAGRAPLVHGAAFAA